MRCLELLRWTFCASSSFVACLFMYAWGVERLDESVSALQKLRTTPEEFQPFVLQMHTLHAVQEGVSCGGTGCSLGTGGWPSAEAEWRDEFAPDDSGDARLAAFLKCKHCSSVAVDVLRRRVFVPFVDELVTALPAKRERKRLQQAVRWVNSSSLHMEVARFPGKSTGELRQLAGTIAATLTAGPPPILRLMGAAVTPDGSMVVTFTDPANSLTALRGLAPATSPVTLHATIGHLHHWPSELFDPVAAHRAAHVLARWTSALKENRCPIPMEIPCNLDDGATLSSARRDGTPTDPSEMQPKGPDDPNMLFYEVPGRGQRFPLPEFELIKSAARVGGERQTLHRFRVRPS